MSKPSDQIHHIQAAEEPTALAVNLSSVEMFLKLLRQTSQDQGPLSFLVVVLTYSLLSVWQRWHWVRSSSLPGVLCSDASANTELANPDPVLMEEVGQ